MSTYFKITNKAKQHLSKRCPKMKLLIASSGDIKREITPDLFTALCHSIVSQQISTKAASTICSRFDALFTTLTPLALCRKRDATIQKCGLSQRKVDYLKGIAKAATSGEINFDELVDYSNEDFISTLTKLKGIGVWTTEMLLLFSLERQDILSYGDLAIRNAIMELYDLPSLSQKEFEPYRSLYSPYGSTASLYLWHSQK